jgi:hypothetical protein
VEVHAVRVRILPVVIDLESEKNNSKTWLKGQRAHTKRGELLDEDKSKVLVVSGVRAVGDGRGNNEAVTCGGGGGAGVPW